MEWANIDTLGSLSFEHVLIEYGIPELFVCRDKDNAPCLVLLLSEKFDYYIVRLTSQELLKLLLNKITLNTALFGLREEAFCYDSVSATSRRISPADIPEEQTYEDDAYLETNDEAYTDLIMKECLG